MSRRRQMVASLLLAGALLLIYGQVGHHDFVGLDDPFYITDNPMVRAGLTGKGAVWAFTTRYGGYWMPLSWLSLQLDAQLYGLAPAGYHLTNVGLHVANSVVLLNVLVGMTGAFWPSAVTTGLFALHPLRVESVAWAAERKDLLSAFFGLLMLGTYCAYVREPRRGRFARVALCLALGLMSKPMLVMLPFTLLLLDWWPLRRLRAGRGAPIPWRDLLRLVVEKLPLIAMAAAVGLVTVAFASKQGAIADPYVHPLSSRLANAAVAYVRYLAKTICPAGLAAFYPYPEGWPAWQVLGSGLLLLTLCVFALAAAPRHPYVAVGWLWFVATLLPVIGIVQAGGQAMADRFTYVPSIGFFMAVTWFVFEAAPVRRLRPPVLAGCALVVLLALGFASWRQVSYWRDRGSLLTHTIAVTTGNWMAHKMLGGLMVEQGRFEEAIPSFERALEINPDYAEAEFGLGLALAQTGRVEEAVVHYTNVVRLEPEFADAHKNLGLLLLARGSLGPAVEHLVRAVEIKPFSAEMHLNLGLALSRQGDDRQATAHFAEALRLKPDFEEARARLGARLADNGPSGETGAPPLPALPVSGPVAQVPQPGSADRRPDLQARVAADHARRGGSRYYLAVSDHFMANHSGTVRSCLEAPKGAPPVAFELFMTVDADGSLSEVSPVPPSAVGTCMAHRLLTDHFPLPPFAPFHASMPMKFAN